MMRRPVDARQAVALIVLAVVAGCTTADCDPSHADLFAGIGCAASGQYGARETGLRNDLAAAQANELEQKASAGRAAAQAQDAQRDLESKQQQVAILDGQLAALKRQVDAARRRQGVDQAALDRARAELAGLQARRAQLSPQSNEAEIRALDEKTRELTRNLNLDAPQ
jgi:chromosome segregation ATPase